MRSRKTVPPTHNHSRSTPKVKEELIARKKKKQSAKRRTVLDYRFHRTDLRLSGLARDAE